MDAINSQIRRIAPPSLIGNILEWYDFALYGYFATVISPLFFPSDNASLSLIVTFTVFAIGFVMRPLGGIIFGYLGDKIGRKKALASAVLLMAIPTTLMGCLPTYAHIGLWAPALLILMRLLQGLAVGGEFTGSMVFIIEHAPASQRGFYGSLAMASAFAGLILGSLVAGVATACASPEALSSWVWRLPFIVSIGLGAVGLYLRMRMPESPAFAHLQKHAAVQHNPFLTACRTAWPQMLLATGLVALPASGFYMSFVYLSSHIAFYLQVELHHALLINSLTMTTIMLVIPVCGYLADRSSRVLVIRLGALGFVCLAIPLYMLLNTATTAAIIITQVGFAICVALSYAAIPVVLVELFPTAVRYSGMALPYNMANAIFGGTAPLVATSLIYYTGSLLSPGFYLAVIGVCVLLLSFYVPRLTRQERT